MNKAEFLPDKNIIRLKWYCADKSEWAKILEFVKNLPGREFLPKEKCWTIPAMSDNINALRGCGWDWDMIGFPAQDKPASGSPEWTEEKIPEEMFPALRPYQIDGLKFLEWRRGRGLITDQMGLGKTPQALSYLKMHSMMRPVLIVCPASIKLQWAREYKKWVGDERIIMLSGKTTSPLPEKYCVCIINWDILYDWTCRVENGKEIWDGPLRQAPFKCIIGDEFQAIGNSSSKRTKAFKRLARKIPNFIGLSGTPIRSRPAQFFNALSLVNPDQFNNEWRFKFRYCDPKSNGFGMTFNGVSHVEELHELVSRVMIRRRKQDVLKDLPAKMRTIVPLPVEDMKSYQAKLDEFMNAQFNRELDKREALAALNYTAFDAKKEIVIRWIEDFLESGEKLVVFAWHRLVIEFLMSRFSGRAVKVDGSVTGKDRDNAVRKFIEDDSVRLFVGNIVAAGVGIDGLQRVCSDAAFVELTFTPTDHAQAEDRLHRYGQEGSVNIYYLIAPETVEENIMEILDKKLKMIDAVVDGENPGEHDMYRELLKGMKV